MRLHALSQKLDRRIERLPKLTFLIVRALKEAVEAPFWKSPLGKWCDEQEHYTNLRDLHRRWEGKTRDETWKNELIAAFIRTEFGRQDFIAKAFSPPKRGEAAGREPSEPGIPT